MKKPAIRLIAAVAMLCMLTSFVFACAPASPAQVPAPTESAAATPAPEASAAGYTPGVYTGEAQGRNGILTVEVTLSETAITAVAVTGHSETPTLSDAPIAQIPQQIVDGQTLNIDSISGATLTSVAVIEAVKDAFSKAGVAPQTLLASAQTTKAELSDVETDVVVVGAGAAGMIASVVVAKGGKNVILVEKQGMLGGGDTMLASTSIRGGGSKVVESLGAENASAEDFYNYLMDQAKTKSIPVDEKNIEAYASISGKMIDWLIDIGVPFTKFQANTFSHITEDGSAPGTHIVSALGKQLDESNVDYRVNTTATSILMENGKASGITVETPDGSYSIKADAVVICTGGYSANKELLAKYSPTWLDRPTTGAKSLTGDGILMAEAVGADVYNMDVVKANYLCHVLPSGDGVSLTAITQYCLLVNHDGNRFVNEGHSSINYKSEQMMQQPNQEAYAIFDQSVIDDLKLMRGYNDAGYFVSANSLEELADKIDVNKENFVSAVSTFQKDAAAGTDTAFERPISDTLEGPTYYAALVTPSMQSTYGGIRVDESCRALNKEKAPIPGLYAAGATSGHDAFANEVGAALIIAVSFGQIAGETVLADLSA